MPQIDVARFECRAPCDEVLLPLSQGVGKRLPVGLLAADRLKGGFGRENLRCVITARGDFVGQARQGSLNTFNDWIAGQRGGGRARNSALRDSPCVMTSLIGMGKAGLACGLGGGGGGGCRRSGRRGSGAGGRGGRGWWFPGRKHWREQKNEERKEWCEMCSFTKWLYERHLQIRQTLVRHCEPCATNYGFLGG